MKKFLLIFLVILMPTASWAIDLLQLECFIIEQKAITSTSTPVTLTTSYCDNSQVVFIVNETAQIRFTTDCSTSPSTTVGTPLEMGQTLILSQHDAKCFNAVKTGSTSAKINVHYFNKP